MAMMSIFLGERKTSGIEPQEHKIKVTRTAHYYSLGNPQNASHLIFACHGYGQLASRFIKPFQSLSLSDCHIIAPEGLSKFYWEGYDGKVSASWMTKEHRLDEIADYSAYLSQLYSRCCEEVSGDAKRILFGFSQGCATILRWCAEKKPPFDEMILWAGWIPEDLDYPDLSDYFKKQGTIHYYRGGNDPFLDPDRVKALQALLKSTQWDYKEHLFEGGHEIRPELLQELLRKI